MFKVMVNALFWRGKVLLTIESLVFSFARSHALRSILHSALASCLLDAKDTAEIKSDGSIQL